MTFWEVDVLGVDILGVDILGVDILRLTQNFISFIQIDMLGTNCQLIICSHCSKSLQSTMAMKTLHASISLILLGAAVVVQSNPHVTPQVL